MKGSIADWLTTYGWAILVVLAALGALFYFGVYSPPYKSMVKNDTPQVSDVQAQNMTVSFWLNTSNSNLKHIAVTGQNICIYVDAQKIICTPGGVPINRDGQIFYDPEVNKFQIWNETLNLTECRMAGDCFSNNNLTGCQQQDCNWCCYNTCSLLGCDVKLGVR